MPDSMESAYWQRLEQKKDELNDLARKMADAKDDAQIAALKKEWEKKMKDHLELIKEKKELDRKQSVDIKQLQQQLNVALTVPAQVRGLIKASCLLVSWRLLVIFLLSLTTITSVHYWISESAQPWSREELKQMIREETDLKGGKR